MFWTGAWLKSQQFTQLPYFCVVLMFQFNFVIAIKGNSPLYCYTEIHMCYVRQSYFCQEDMKIIWVLLERVQKENHEWNKGNLSSSYSDLLVDCLISKCKCMNAKLGWKLNFYPFWSLEKEKKKKVGVWVYNYLCLQWINFLSREFSHDCMTFTLEVGDVPTLWPKYNKSEQSKVCSFSSGYILSL